MIRKMMLTAAVGLYTLVAAAPEQAEAFNQMVVFGDSLSDTGNVFAASGGFFPPSPPYDGGRFANGPVWVEYLAGQLGLPAPTARGIMPAPAGTNYAWGGAPSGLSEVFYSSTVEAALGVQFNPPLGGSLPIGQQVLQYATDVLAGQAPAPDENTLFTLWGGANDLLLANEQDGKRPANNITTYVELLIAAGAKHIVVPNMPEVGDTPGLTDPVAHASAFVSVEAASNPKDPKFASQVKRYNQRLRSNLNRIEAQNPDVSIYRLDIFELFKDAQAGAFFPLIQNTTLPVINETALYAGVGFPGFLNVPLEDIPTSLFWDSVHPTATAHAIIGDTAAGLILGPPAPGASGTIPEPATCLVLGVGALALLPRRKAA